MIKEWFTARELIELELDKIPTSVAGILKKADRENWRSRDRLASGGGKEYHISNLPDKAQIELLDKIIGTDAIADSVLCDRHDDSRCAVTTEDRRNARLIIVALFKRFRKSVGLGVLAAEQPFLKFYQSEGMKSGSKLVPDWVYGIYPDFSVQSLRNWRACAKKNDGLKDLTDKYGNRKGTGVLDRAENGEVATYIHALITHNGHLKAGHVRDMCRAKWGNTLRVKNKNGDEEEKPLPQIRTFERFIYAFKQENKDLMLKLTDPDGYKNKIMLATGRADAHIERLNQEWEIDASPADVLCTDGRYNLYAIIDIFSRRSMFLVTKTPRTEAALSLIRKAIMEWGVPETIKTDNGSDFISHRFQTALLALGIEQDICSPFSPEKKPYVERVFGTLHRDLGPILPGFIGHDVADRKKIEAKKAFSARLGEKEQDAFAVGLSSEDLQRHIDTWASGKYEHRVHSTIGVSPFQKANSWTGSIKTISSERAIDILLAPIASGKGWRKVTKEGIRVERGRFMAPELAMYVSKEVFVRHDPADMGRIYVFDNDDNFICEAKNVERLGIDRLALTEQSKAAQKEHIRELTKDIKKAARSIKPEDFIDAYLQTEAEKAENIIPLPRERTEHTSKGLSEAERAVFRPQLPEKTELSEKQQKAHKKLVEEMSKSQPTKLLKTEDRQTRFRRALNLESRLNEGLRITEEDNKWLSRYQTTPEYRSQKSMLEDFGTSWLEKGDLNA